MKAHEVPQEGLAYKDRDKLRKLMYATDKDGNYTGIPSAGWAAENAATEAAWLETEELIKETEAAVRAGLQSPVAYFMQKRLMDVAILAKYVRKWDWQVRRHLRPENFAKLSAATLRKYAEVFEISLKELQHPDIR